jgi:tripartite-type tricarboxylate transporter receptor subunit TctC
MKLSRRQFLATSAAVLAPMPDLAWAQGYPMRPVRIVVGFPAGGISDTYARLIGQWLSERLGQSFIIENRSGAGGNIAAEAVVRAAADGYTLLLTASSDAWSTALYDNLSFNYIRDIVPVASISKGMGVLVVHPSFPARTVPELIAYAKDNPGKITVASDGVGTGPHVFWELFRSMTGLDLVHVPYRGAATVLPDLFSGQVQTYFGYMAPTIEHIRAGKLRPLAVTGATRAEALPDVPTIAEFLPGYDATGWNGIAVPRNTPAAVVAKLSEEINAGLADARIKARIADFGDVPFASSPAEFAQYVVEFTEKWGKVIRAAGIRAG